MLLTYSVQNFKCIGSKQTIDFIATPKNEYEELLYNVNDSLNVNSGLCFIGPNGSGKSQLLKSLFTLSNITSKSNYNNIVEPFSLNKKWKLEPTKFEVLMYSIDLEEFLSYQLSIEKNQILSERLVAKSNKKASKNRLIFSRENNHVTLGSDIKVSVDMINGTIDRESTLISYARGINIPQLKEVLFILTNIFLYTPDIVKGIGPNLINNLIFRNENNLSTEDLISQVNNIFEHTTKLLKSLDFKINKIKAVSFEDEFQIKIFPETCDDSEVYLTLSEAGNFFSEGTYSTIILVLIIGLTAPFQHLLLLDEIDGALHHKLTIALLDLIRCAQNTQKSQFLLSTHDIMVLDNKFRRDAIFNFNKDNSLETKITRVSDFSIRKDVKLSAKYFANEFGGLPNILKLQD
ncbi:ATP-binding protein [Photobacterium damselae subsp. damselae]|uniref:ATP-binding protein n=1 Tax=Photobacterium damselae subsp. damselae TaxID=85581 RepID=A0A850R6V5_PHODD|nr:ATP-binding protein [Photobacterium damselae subsp. damselae]